MYMGKHIHMRPLSQKYTPSQIFRYITLSQKPDSALFSLSKMRPDKKEKENLIDLWNIKNHNKKRSMNQSLSLEYCSNETPLHAKGIG